MKPSQPNRITTIGQWFSPFTVYAAVLIEHSPQAYLSTSLTSQKWHVGLGVLAWKRYDESFRSDKRANKLSFGQVNWDLRCRCLELAVNKPNSYSFHGTDTRTPYSRTRSVCLLGQAFPVELFRKGNVTNLSNSALDPGMPANSNMHAPSDSHVNCGCWGCSGCCCCCRCCWWYCCYCCVCASSSSQWWHFYSFESTSQTSKTYKKDAHILPYLLALATCVNPNSRSGDCVYVFNLFFYEYQSIPPKSLVSSISTQHIYILNTLIP